MPKNNTVKLIIAFVLGLAVAHFMHGGGIPGTGSKGSGKP